MTRVLTLAALLAAMPAAAEPLRVAGLALGEGLAGAPARAAAHGFAPDRLAASRSTPRSAGSLSLRRVDGHAITLGGDGAGRIAHIAYAMDPDTYALVAARLTERLGRPSRASRDPVSESLVWERRTGRQGPGGHEVVAVALSRDGASHRLVLDRLAVDGLRLPPLLAAPSGLGGAAD